MFPFDDVIMCWVGIKKVPIGYVHIMFNNFLRKTVTKDKYTFLIYRDITWTSWCLKSPPFQPFVQLLVETYHEENVKHRLTGPSWWESTSVVDSPRKEPRGYFKMANGLLNLRDLKFSPVNKMHIFQCMGETFCVEFQRGSLEFPTNILPIHWKMWFFLYNVEILRALGFKSS